MPWFSTHGQGFRFPSRFFVPIAAFFFWLFNTPSPYQPTGRSSSRICPLLSGVIGAFPFPMAPRPWAGILVFGAAVAVVRCGWLVKEQANAKPLTPALLYFERVTKTKAIFNRPLSPYLRPLFQAW